MVEQVVNNESDISRDKCTYIKRYVESYLKKKANLSLQSLADRAGVPYSTLRRYVNNAGSPNSESVIKLFYYMGEDKALNSYLEEFHPEIARFMKSKSDHNCDVEFLPKNYAEYFADDDYFLIISLAFTKSGTSKEEVMSELGSLGVERLDRLVERGIITKKDNRYCGNINVFKTSFADTKKQVEMAMRFYKLYEAGDINNWISLQTESINEEGLKELKKLNKRQFLERKNQIFNNPMYNGDIKVFSSSVSSTFLSYKKSEVLQ